MVTIPALIKANQERWTNAQYHPHYWTIAQHVAARLCAPQAKAIYQDLERTTGVPWWAIALIHEREASQSWQANIAQGDPWNRVSRHVPAGRGPFTDFKTAAVDALTNCAPYAARWHDWSAGGSLSLLELYNGEGYENYHHMASPYLWSGSDQYIRGKYVADNHFDATAVDTQLGCAIMLKAMMAIDPSISFEPVQVAAPAPGPEMPPAYVDMEPVGQDFGRAPLPPTPFNNFPPPPTSLPPPVGADTVKMEDVLGANMTLGQAKSVFKSKTQWITSLLGIGGGASVLSSDNGLFQQVSTLLTSPQFWMIVGVLVMVGSSFYFYWRDHGKGSTR